MPIVAKVAAACVPSLEDVLSTLAFHVSGLMTDRPGEGVKRSSVGVGFGLGGYKGTDCPCVFVEGHITAACPVGDSKEDPWGGWAQVTLDGRLRGNRSGGREYLMKAYAPVIAWVAAYHARTL